MIKWEIRQEIRGIYEEMRTMEIKPNFSAIARKYKIDRHTAAKYWDNDKQVVELPQRPSKLDPYFEEIKEKAENTVCTKMALYQYFRNKYGEAVFGHYSTFAHYMQRKELERKVEMKAHVRYETPAGNQLQVDWKENLSTVLKTGEIIEYNLFVATLGYSRYHFYIYSKSKATDDFLRCLIEVLQRMGGIPKMVVTDNMSAIVSIRANSRDKLPVIRQFEKDIGVKIHLCKVRTPQTKGKVESANRYVQWLEPYNGELGSEEELIELIRKFEHDVNNETNHTTGIPPVKLIKKEMEHLNPIPNKLLMNEFIRNVTVQTVPQTLLIRYKGSEYSVPSKFIGRRVKVIPSGDKLYIYHNTELISLHELSVKKINYQEDHYENGLRQSMTAKISDSEIHLRAKENLALLDQWEETSGL